MVKKDDKQFLVTVTDEFIETRKLAKRVNSKKLKSGIGNSPNVNTKLNIEGCKIIDKPNFGCIIGIRNN